MFMSEGKGITDSMALFHLANNFLSISIAFMTFVQVLACFL